MAPSSTLPDHVYDTLKFSPRSPINEEEEEEEEEEEAAAPADCRQAVLRAGELGSDAACQLAHSRNSSLDKPQSGGLVAKPSSQFTSPSRTIYASASRSFAETIFDQFADPKVAASYGHHRQTSIVHSRIQHSRNGSHASSTSSPLSPEIIAAAGARLTPDRLDGLDRPDMNPYGCTDGDSAAGSRPSTALFGTTINLAQLPERTSSATEASTNSHRKPEQTNSQSGRRRDHSRHHSHSRHHKDDQKTVGEYTLHVLFTSFIAQAEEKLNESTTVPLDPEPHIEEICGPGVDSAFDQSISALGHIASPKPKDLIDSMMLWRKNKSDAANEARAASKAQMPIGPLQRRNTESVQPNGMGDPLHINGQSFASRLEYVAQAERRSLVSIYILCRVLLEVISQTTLASITPEMEDKLEGIIFSQLKIADTDQLMFSPLKLANWNLFTQLLGAMSELNLKSVTDRFIADLDRSIQEHGALKSPMSASRDTNEGKIELVLGGMKHLRLRTNPTDAWDQTCNFMIALGKLFARCHGQKVKAAFCHVLQILVLPIAAQANSSDLSNPKWAEVLSNISPRLAQIFIKPKNWTFTFPLTAAMLCVSPPDTFSSQWLQLVYPLQTRFKDRYAKPFCLQILSRLVWTYLIRTTDTAAGTFRKLDEVVKLILPPAKRSLVASDPCVADPLIQLIRIIGFKQPEYCFKYIIFPLVHADQFNANSNLKIENLDPDKMVIGIRSFLAIISDLERGEEGCPPFPQWYPDPPPPPDRMPTSPILASPMSSMAQRLPAIASSREGSTAPVVSHMLSDTVKEFHAKFCGILGKITLMCDNTFGGQAALDEKFSNPGPKTPISETFTFRKDDHQTPQELKQAFYELLHVAVQALPRCLSADIPFNSLINLLCTGTAHLQYHIADSSAQSLKAIARQSYAQQVTTGFSRFIFNFDDRYSTISDGGMLGPGHVENTLRLYVELLRIWIEEIKRRQAQAISEPSDILAEKRGFQLDKSSIWAEVDQIEAHGLFFLCSQSRTVRYFAITVLRLITEFDTALGKSTSEEKDTLRLMDILENDSMQVMNFKDDQLSVAERSRIERGMQDNNNQGALIELCTSDVSYDTTLWFKLFPNLIRVAYEKCPFTVTIGRDLVCNRILQMYKTITLLSEPSRGLYYGSDPGSSRFVGRTPTTQPDVLVEQWKLFLVFACTTLADPGNPQSNPLHGSPHLRKGSFASSTDKIVSARTLFKYLNPLLSVSSVSVREAVVTAMGSINIYIYRTLLEELQGYASRCNDEARARIHQRTNSSPRRNRKMDLLRTEITHVYKLTSHFLKEPDVYQDDWILNNLVSYAKDLKIFLMDGEVQMDWEFQKLRRHYCGLMEELFEGINRTSDPSRWMTFEARKSSFALMEEWCGFSPNQPQIQQREDSMRRSMIDQQNLGERSTASAAMEIEKRNLRTAALSAMAALCAGPISVTTESGASLQFDVRRMLAWIEAIFSNGNDRMKMIGRRALKNLIVYNQDFPYLLEHCISRCYLTDVPKVLESYYTVVTEVLLEHADYPSPFWKLLGLCLFTLGNDQSGIRSRSAQVLQAIEEQHLQAKASKIQDFDISISDKTKAVYKLAQYRISERLSKQHAELAFYLFSEFTLYFKDLEPVSQRSVVAVILPWIQSVELKVDPNGGPTGHSYVLLANLLEITIKASAALHNEVQALWQALATGPYPGNVRLVLDFIMSLCLERREQNFVEYAKQIVVFLASTNSNPGHKVVEFLLLQITPKAMVPNEKREMVPPPVDTQHFPYCADLADALPIGTKQAGFSLGQLSLILLVDLMVSPVNLQKDSLPVLLQVVTVLWDHYTPLVQEQAREMLVHLIHELVISKLDDETPMEIKQPIEDLIELIRRHDRSVVWSYEDSNGKVTDHDTRVPTSMEFLTTRMVDTFELTFPGIKEQWARLSLTWATTCPVRHLACRSFQIFRCILTSLDQYMLGDMLARLSNTVADEDAEIQSFAMEILTTLKTLIAKLDAEQLRTFPQLFWTTCACMESINECEFLESVEMLNEFMDKVDFGQPAVRRALMDGQPAKWDGQFDGLQQLLYKGLRSSLCLDATLRTVNRVVRLPSDPLIGDDNRIFFAVLANLPRYLHAAEQETLPEDVAQGAEALLAVAVSQGLSSLALVLNDYLSRNHESARDFVKQIMGALRETFLPQLDFAMVTTLMGMLTNRQAWVKTNTMRILSVIIPDVDMRKPEMAGHGPDLISPLLRLLQTEFCMDALGVLDNITTMSGSTMDKHHLRMSMTRPTSKAVRKEYERTQSLFGIPEDSGWAIPAPAKKTDSTRANIHAAFYMCHSEGGIAVEAAPTPAVEFQADNFPYSYFPRSGGDRTDTMRSDEGGRAESAGDLVSKLDSLDDFFDDLPQSPPSDGRSSRTITEFTPDTFDASGSIYDEQVLPILRMAGSASTTSFQNGFADRPSPAGMATNPREGGATANTMTPGAFARPGLHSRSVTSPSAPASYNFDDLHEDVFSDVEDNGSAPGHMEGSFLLENMVKRAPPRLSRSRVKGLTGSLEALPEWEMPHHGGGPVPLVPTAVLQNAPHSDMV